MTLLELVGEEYLVLRLVLVGVAITNVAFGIYVYAKNPKNLPNRVFAAFAGSIALWTAGVIFARTASSPPILDRLMFVGGSLAMLCVLGLFKCLPRGAALRGQRDLLFFAAAGVVMALLSFTPLVYREAIIRDGTHQGLYGPLYPVAAAYLLSCFGGCVGTLWRRLSRATGLARLQLQYLLLGVVAPGAAALITNLIFPLFLGTQALSGYGPFFTVPMVSLVAHAIVRHRLMDIRVMIRQGTVCAVAGVILAVPALAVVVAVKVWVAEATWGVILDAFVVGAVALVAAPLRNRLDRVLNAYVYRERYTYHETIQEATRRLAQLQPVERVVNDLCVVVERTVRPEAIALWLLAGEGSGYRRLVPSGDAAVPEVSAPHDISVTSPLARWLAAHSQILLRDDIVRADHEWQGAITELATLGGELGVPISAGQGLDGILLVGPKRSGDPYFEEDLALVSALATEAAVALANASLHQDVVQAREQMEALLETMPGGVVAVNRLGQVEWFNDTAERLTRLPRGSVVGRGLPVSHPLSRLMEATLADGQPRQEEIELGDRPGPPIHLVCSVGPFRGRDGEIVGAVCVASDLSRLKEMEAENRRVERLATFGAMASGIAHEVRNPLVAIKTHLQLLPEECTCAAQDEQRHYSAVATREIDRIDALLERLIEMRDFPRASFAPVDLRDVLAETLLLLRDAVTRDSVTIVRELQPGCWVSGDREQLKQLFVNLLVNAREAVPGGGEIGVRCWISEGRSRPAAVVEISDNGPGIPDAVQETLFEPFVTTKPRGTGLGLAICRAIADVHRATIRAENRAHAAGATVIVAFPAGDRPLPDAFS